MHQGATDDQPAEAVVTVPAQQRRDMVIFGDRRLGLPQQIAHAASLFHSQFGITPAVVCLSCTDAPPSCAGQIAGVPVQVLPSIPPGYVWLQGTVATRSDRYDHTDTPACAVATAGASTW